jgi:hypothetical protein
MEYLLILVAAIRPDTDICRPKQDTFLHRNIYDIFTPEWREYS